MSELRKRHKNIDKINDTPIIEEQESSWIVRSSRGDDFYTIENSGVTIDKITVLFRNR
jgi:hypothetical protein